MESSWIHWGAILRAGLLAAAMWGVGGMMAGLPQAQAGDASSSAVMTLASPQARPIILLRTDATEAEQFAARELATYLGKMVGRSVPVRTGDVALQGSAAEPVIILGHHPANLELDPGDLGVEDAIRSVEPHRLRLIGGKRPSVTNSRGRVFVQERGTLYGVYNLLDELGVRWYRPDPWGEHVPTHERIELPLGVVRQGVPGYKYRSGIWQYGAWDGQTKEQYELAGLWATRNRHNVRQWARPAYGGNHMITHNHALPSLVPAALFKEHPEYFALVKGERKVNHHRCLSNPDVRSLVARRVIANIRANPENEMISIEQGDGMGFCECESCRALDDPKLLALNGGDARLGRASMSNRVADFANDVARQVGREYPDVLLAFLGYLSHTEAPTLIDELEPNLVVMPAPFAGAYSDYSKPLPTGHTYEPYMERKDANTNFMNALQGWHRISRNMLMTREYWSGGTWFGPLPILHTLKDRLSVYRQYNVQGVYSESVISWGPQTPVYYFFLRLMWNPDLDLEAELKLFCENYYGPAGATMFRYHMALEDIGRSGPAFLFLGRFVDGIFNDAAVARLAPLMSAAKGQVQGHPLYEQRLAGDAAGFEVVRVRNRVERLKREKKYAQAVAEWDRLAEYILSFEAGDTFNRGKTVMTHGVWKIMGDQAGVPMMRREVQKLKKKQQD